MSGYLSGPLNSSFGSQAGGVIGTLPATPTTTSTPVANTQVDPNNVSIIVTTTNGQVLTVSGFVECEITRGIEIMPSNFVVRTTDKYSYEQALVFNIGDPCKIMIGSDLVITGYIDRIDIQYSAHSHDLTISGTSKCGDIVKSAALFLSSSQLAALKSNPQTPVKANSANSSDPGQMVGTANFSNITQIATALLAPFNISISQSSTVINTKLQMPAWTINLGMTVYEALEQCARFYGVLLYDDTAGNLVISQVGTTQHTGSLIDDAIQEASISFDMSNRFSQYIAVYQTVDASGDLIPNADTIGVVVDNNINRYLPTIIQSEQVSVDAQNGGATTSLAYQSAQWMCQRNVGRGETANITLTSWRDAGGLLWQPNYLVNVNAPNLKVVNQNLIISKATYKKSTELGTTCELELMLKAAFEVEPISLVTAQADLMTNISQRNSGDTNATPTPPADTNLPDPASGAGTATDNGTTQ